MDETSERTKVLKNGAVYDMDQKRIVKGAVISSVRAVELVNIREQKRRDIARQAANEAVERGDYKQKYGDFAFVAAVVETAMIKATTADDPKAIEAARFVMQVTGESENPTGSVPVPLSEVADLFRAVAEMARAARDE